MLLFKLFSRKSLFAQPAPYVPDPAQEIDTAGFNQLASCRHGPLLYNANDQYVGRSLALYGEFSEQEMDVFRHFVNPGDVVLEVGANIGAHTVSLAGLVGPEGVVYALEPQRLVFQVLCANVALNSLSNVHAYHAAAAAAAGSITVPELDPQTFQNFGGLSIQGHEAGTVVPVITLDSLGLGRCALLKVDVEGMEQEVLSGAVDTIARLRPVMYVENDRKEKSPALITMLQSLGYKLWWHLPPLFNPENFAGNPDNVFGNIVSCNLLCIPAERDIQLPEVMAVRGPEDWRLSS